MVMVGVWDAPAVGLPYCRSASVARSAGCSFEGEKWMDGEHLRKIISVIWKCLDSEI